MCNRSPNDSSHPSRNQHTMQQLQNQRQKQIPAELVTYRLDGEMVYVEPARDYEQALDYAQSAFPGLRDAARSLIAFSVNVRVNGAPRTVRIAPMVWHRVLQSLATYEIIDLSILSAPPTIKSEAEQSPTALQGVASASESSTDEAPPKFGTGNMLGAELFNRTLEPKKCTHPYLTLQSSVTQAMESPPSPATNWWASSLRRFKRLLLT